MTQTNIVKSFRASEDYARIERRRKETAYKLSIADTAGSADAVDEFLAQAESLVDRESAVLLGWLHSNDDLRERREMCEEWRRGLEPALEEVWSAIAQRRSGEASALPTGARAKYQAMIEAAAERLSGRVNRILI